MRGRWYEIFWLWKDVVYRARRRAPWTRVGFRQNTIFIFAEQSHFLWSAELKKGKTQLATMSSATNPTTATLPAEKPNPLLALFRRYGLRNVARVVVGALFGPIQRDAPAPQYATDHVLAQLPTDLLSGKTFAITGCSRGIGLQLAKTIAARGGDIVPAQPCFNAGKGSAGGNSEKQLQKR